MDEKNKFYSTKDSKKVKLFEIGSLEVWVKGIQI